MNIEQCNTGMLFLVFGKGFGFLFEPRHDKTKSVAVRSAKTQISLGIRPV